MIILYWALGVVGYLVAYVWSARYILRTFLGSEGWEAENSDYGFAAAMAFLWPITVPTCWLLFDPKYKPRRVSEILLGLAKFIQKGNDI